MLVFALRTPTRPINASGLAARSTARQVQSLDGPLHVDRAIDGHTGEVFPVSRPPVSVERLSLTAQGHVRYRLKAPFRDGTTDIMLEPLHFIARLAALVPPPRAFDEVPRSVRRQCRAARGDHAGGAGVEGAKRTRTVWREHPDRAPALLEALEELLTERMRHRAILERIGRRLPSLADDPAFHIHLEPLEKYRALVRSRLFPQPPN